MNVPSNKKLKSVKSLLPNKDHEKLTPETVRSARGYIKNYWSKLLRDNPADDETLIGLPHPYLVPSYEQGHEFDFNELYYWDSYFMALGLMTPENKQLVLGILEDLFFLFEKFGIIPNASRTYMMSRSQPPLLTSFILDAFQTYNLDHEWLARAIKIAQAEYKTVWMGTTKPNARQVHDGLSRYYDINYLHDLAEGESGWDKTTRFSHRCMDYLPIDLNCLLYKYERDFAYCERLLGNEEAAVYWERVAHDRRMKINELMWSDLRGFYYDYDYTKEKRGNVDSLAAYYTLWVGIASEKQAAKLVGALKKFENRGGLATTNTMPLSQYMTTGKPVQWAYPNGWAPLQYIVVKGLQKYGYKKEAERIAKKWVNCNLRWFNKHGVFLEKYNVVQTDKPPARGLYPSQTGFGWTNAIFEVFCQEFIDK